MVHSKTTTNFVLMKAVKGSDEGILTFNAIIAPLTLSEPFE